jgi:hypothetical protein
VTLQHQDHRIPFVDMAHRGFAAAQKNWIQAKIQCLEILDMNWHTLHTSNDAPV